MFTSEPTGPLTFANKPHYLIDTCDQPGLTAGFFVAPNSPIAGDRRHVISLDVSIKTIESKIRHLAAICFPQFRFRKHMGAASRIGVEKSHDESIAPCRGAASLFGRADPELFERPNWRHRREGRW
jgi:hypothetical protein